MKIWAKDKEGRRFTKCRKCGRTDRKHQGKGLCKVCYAYNWTIINKEKNRAKSLKWYHAQRVKENLTRA